MTMSWFTICRNVHINWRNQLTKTLSSPSESQVHNQFSSGERMKKKQHQPENFPHIRKYSLRKNLLPSSIFSTGIQFFFKKLLCSGDTAGTTFRCGPILLVFNDSLAIHIPPHQLVPVATKPNVNVEVGHIYMSPLMLISITVPHSLRDAINHLEYD